ncbi:MAG: T9SS type A sorting domain-containing protein, partial [Sphingobacteriales bacterium]
NPQYTAIATGDLTPMNSALYSNGTNTQADVPRDILGRFRSTTPTPGAFEISTDAGVTALVSPLGTYCSSIKQVSVSIVNAGITTINTVQVNWRLNGVLQTPVTYNGTLVTGATAAVTLGNGLFMPNTPVEIKAWTSMPNNQVDGIPYNDTLVVTTQSSTSVPVNLGQDELICTGSTRVLDAGYPGAVYVWDNNSTAQTRTVSLAGTYYVKLTALDGCIGVDTFVLGLRPLPVVDLGPDREICLGQTTTFDAGHPGAQYLWDDGSTQQTYTVDTAGSYEVQVTDQFGCMGVDNVNVGMKDIPMVEGINATHADSGTYTFYPINPQYTISYRWNFGDGSPEVTGFMVQHTYTTLGIYTVTLYLEGECTGLIIDNSRTVDVFSVPGGGSTGIGNQLAEGNFTMFPNPARNVINIQNNSQDKLQRLVVYNALGQVMVSEQANNEKSHVLNLEGLANGLYTLRLETDKGYLVRKFEVMK